MIATRSPVDELANLRLKIAELRAREAMLEIQFVENNDLGRVRGFHHDVVIERNRHQIFDVMLLPDDILNDARFYSTRFTTNIRVEDKIDLPLFMEPAGSDFDIIERGA